MNLIKTRSAEDRILEELKKPRIEGDNRAVYKLELQFAKARTANLHSPNVCLLSIWESGKMMSGDGDIKMYWCGYEDCQMPIRAEFFVDFICVCPSCKRQCLRHESDRAELKKLIKFNDTHVANTEIPEAWSDRIYKLTPSKMAQQLERRWHDIGGDADIYVKFHSKDIRSQDVIEIHKADAYRTAREARAKNRYVIYTAPRIHKDIAAGATLWKRFLALLTS